MSESRTKGTLVITLTAHNTSGAFVCLDHPGFTSQYWLPGSIAKRVITELIGTCSDSNGLLTGPSISVSDNDEDKK